MVVQLHKLSVEPRLREKQLRNHIPSKDESRDHHSSVVYIPTWMVAIVDKKSLYHIVSEVLMLEISITNPLLHTYLH